MDGEGHVRGVGGVGRLSQVYGSPALGFHRESRGEGLGGTPWVHVGRSGRPADSH